MSEYNTATSSANTFSFDLSDVLDPSDIPPGEYALEIVNVQVVKTPEGAVDRLTVEFAATLPDDSVRAVGDTFRLSKARDRGRLKKLLTILGVNSLGGVLSESDFVGKEISAYCKFDTFWDENRAVRYMKPFDPAARLSA